MFSKFKTLSLGIGYYLFIVQFLDFSQFGSNRQLDRIGDICYLNFSRQHPDENCRWVADTATYCDSFGYIHNLKFSLIPLSKKEFLSTIEIVD